MRAMRSKPKASAVRAELARADLALALVDARDPPPGALRWMATLHADRALAGCTTKADLLDGPALPADALYDVGAHGRGLEALHARLLALAGAGATADEAHSAPVSATWILPSPPPPTTLSSAADELAAERLDLAADALARAHAARANRRQARRGCTIGHIFGTFCIGKVGFLSYPALTNVRTDASYQQVRLASKGVPMMSANNSLRRLGPVALTLTVACALGARKKDEPAADADAGLPPSSRRLHRPRNRWCRRRSRR